MKFKISMWMAIIALFTAVTIPVSPAAQAAAQVHSAQIAPPSGAASFANLSPAERAARIRSLMARHSQRFGTSHPSPR